MSSSKVINLNKFKEEVENKEAQEIVDYVIDGQLLLPKGRSLFLARRRRAEH